jgi:voltage-dependent potassium channel beta subunit
MEYRRVGASGLKVSEIAYGSWVTFGNQVELDQSKELVKKALELGINYIDTADIYNRGQAEEFLGTVLPSLNRRHYILATKAFWPMSDAPTDRGLSRKHITDSLHGSLERLKLSYVDLFYCHRFDPETPLEETLEAIEDLIRQGKILYWGTSEWTASQIAQAHSICVARGWHRPIINQPVYSLAHRGIEKEILPTCVSLGMGTANFSPLAQGILTGKYSGGTIPQGSRGGDEKLGMFMKTNLSNTKLLKAVDELKPIAESYGLTQGQLALAWILNNPGISSVIMGATSVKQLEENVKASGIKLKERDVKKIEKLFPVGE